ncbi:MAG: RNA polymerase sigma factor [Acidimicrobiales bacterium]
METAPELVRGDDVALLAAVADGDAHAVSRLLDEVAPTVYGFLLARVGGPSAAEDLLQETLLEGLRSQHTFRGESSLSTWLCAIARRRLARHYESERRSELAQSGLKMVPAPETGGAEEAIDQREAVLAALGQLPVLHRQVLVLKYLDGCSVSEIASAVGKSSVQVQSLLQRARDGLRRQLEDGDG